MIIERESWSQGSNVYIRPNITFKDGVHPPPYSLRIPVIHPLPIYHLFLQRVVEVLTAIPSPTPFFRSRELAHRCYSAQFERCSRTASSVEVDAEVATTASRIVRISRTVVSVLCFPHPTSTMMTASSLSGLVEQVRSGIDGILESDDTAKGKTRVALVVSAAFSAGWKKSLPVSPPPRTPVRPLPSVQTSLLAPDLPSQAPQVPRPHSEVSPAPSFHPQTLPQSP
ncbi:hypothetical protein GYMLUDRAFT_252379 [Collybiopsis luxurians FD-317 M1]|uniref:Uncharacterized protein n=1 Tax=Collybiopsis luxurians FD-317 M1 TaxID=944289 RepID=A0A0D0C8K9_9AGAR|nr:hypothetical protein GYMLUDRAFT_252379 [Collybiopsis luxurians FD-317 M1]